MTRAGTAVRRLAAGAWVNSMSRRVAAARGHGLALVYHRVGVPGNGAVPAISAELFARQLSLLTELGPVVPAQDLLQSSPPGAVRFALTFDDDYRSHLEHVLSALLEHEVSATFFLSGRSLFGLPRYWFEVIDDLLATGSVAELARVLRIEASDVDALLSACASDPSMAKRVEALSQSPADHLGTQDIREMVDAGMSIGFHTLEHPELRSLTDADLELALQRGRDDIERAAGVPMRLFAYPFGRTDARVSEAVARAGYVAAFTGVPGPVTARTDRFQVPRWEPGPLDERAFVAEIAVRLQRAVPEGAT